jgi:hypothetical protein
MATESPELKTTIAVALTDRRFRKRAGRERAFFGGYFEEALAHRSGS